MGTKIKETYLGNSVYAKFDGYNIVLTTDNGFGASNTIVLEPIVYDALIQYNERIKKMLKNLNQ